MKFIELFYASVFIDNEIDNNDNNVIATIIISIFFNFLTLMYLFIKEYSCLNETLLFVGSLQ